MRPIGVIVELFWPYEKYHIVKTLSSMIEQDTISTGEFDIKAFVLAGGCSDATVGRSEATIKATAWRNLWCDAHKAAKGNLPPPL